MAATPNQEEVSAEVTQAAEQTKQLKMISSLKQLRLRAPNMIRREYEGLMKKVKLTEETQSTQLLSSALRDNEGYTASFLTPSLQTKKLKA